MIVEGVLILYTSNPSCPQMRAWVRTVESTGVAVFLKPLTQLPQQPKVTVTPGLLRSLTRVQPN